MNVPSDRVPASVSPALRSSPAAPPAESRTAELPREINARRAQIENPELLRRLRSL